MGACYAVDVEDTNTVDTTVGAINAASSVPCRLRLYELEIGSKATPADNNAEWHLQRITTVGTRTARTARALDPADATSLSQCGEAHSAEPTYTANEILKAVGVNMRATYRWSALGPDRAYIIPATANNGIGLIARTISGSAWAAVATFYWEE